MLEKTLLLDNIDKVREFVDIATSKEYKITLKSDKFIVDAKSIMAVFSLDLTKPVKMQADCKTVIDLTRQIEKFVYQK